MPQGKGQDVPLDGVMSRDQEPGPILSACIPLHFPCANARKAKTIKIN